MCILAVSPTFCKRKKQKNQIFFFGVMDDITHLISVCYGSANRMASLRRLKRGRSGDGWAQKKGPGVA